MLVSRIHFVSAPVNMTLLLPADQCLQGPSSGSLISMQHLMAVWLHSIVRMTKGESVSLLGSSIAHSPCWSKLADFGSVACCSSSLNLTHKPIQDIPKLSLFRNVHCVPPAAFPFEGLLVCCTGFAGAAEAALAAAGLVTPADVAARCCNTLQQVIDCLLPG